MQIYIILSNARKITSAKLEMDALKRSWPIDYSHFLIFASHEDTIHDSMSVKEKEREREMLPESGDKK